MNTAENFIIWYARNLNATDGAIKSKLASLPTNEVTRIKRVMGLGAEQS